MKPLLFHFYRMEDCVGSDGATLDYGKLASARPVDSIRARQEVLLRMHLQHLGFDISKLLPRFEGRFLHAELVFAGPEDKPKMPVLVAMDGQKAVAARRIRLETLDVSPFLSVLLARKPELRSARLVFRVTWEEEAGTTGEEGVS